MYHLNGIKGGSQAENQLPGPLDSHAQTHNDALLQHAAIQLASFI